jgi:hypothetical protein
MKYIKTYTKLLTSRECLKTLFESNESQWVKDSLLDLTDEGYNVNIRTFTVTGENTPGLAITIDSSNKKLLPFSIGEYLLTIDSYLKERGFKGYNPFDWDNEFSKSRYVVRVRALLNDETNSYELKEFNDLKKCNKDSDCMASCAQKDCFNRQLVNDCPFPTKIDCACINKLCQKAR